MSAITLTESNRWRPCASDRRAEAGLLVLVCRARELDDRFLALERILAVDLDPFRSDLDDVVAGPSVSPEAMRRDRPGCDDEEVLEMPGIRHVLVARQDELHPGAQQHLQQVARVVDDVALAPRAGD